MSELELFPRDVPHELVLTPDGALTPRAENYLARRIEGELARTGETGVTIVHGSNAARAFVARGEWVAECPRSPDCKQVEYLTDKPARWRHQHSYAEGERITLFTCKNCGLITHLIDWPQDADEIMAVLNRRPVPDTRNWYPVGHLIAVTHNEPHGQTVADLERENREHGIDL